MEQEVKLIVGLGNPGSEYAKTRHNAGFMVLEKLLAKFPAGRFEKEHTAASFIYSGNFRGRKIILQFPQTFMNLSGTAVANLANKLGIAPHEILVISDDLDLPAGRLRLRNGGSDGGHNGLKSIIAELGSNSFRRVRVGIGRPKPDTTVDYVLSAFEGAESAIFESSLEAAAEAVRTVLTCGMSRAMNQFNAWVPPQEIETNQKNEVVF